MNMKVLHTADWHLGIDLHRMSLLKDQAFFLEQLIHIVKEEAIDVVLISGDIFDTVLASKEAIELYNHVITTLCLTLKKQVVVIAGNHDSPTRIAGFAKLLAPMGLHVVGKVDKKIQGINLGDVRIYPIPFFHLDTIRNVYEVPIRDTQQAFEVMVSHIQEHMDASHKNILMAHTFAAGSSVCESDRFANVGGSDLLDSSVFAPFDYVALGHLHRFQKAGNHTYYSGSPLAYSFSEAGYKKCVLIYDTNTETVQEVEIQPLHTLKVLTGSFDELKEKATQAIQDASYLKIEVEDAMVSYEMLAYFRSHFDNLLQLSGKTNQVEDASISLSIEEIDTIQDMDIVKQFFKDYFDQELQEEECSLFEEARQACGGNDEVCVQ